MRDLKKLQLLSKNYSILYVEDNESLRNNVNKLLSKLFHLVTLAKDGQEALAKFKKHKFPIIITDIKMPNMDGITLVKQIRKISPDTHIIVMSAYDDKEYLLDMIEYGVFKFLKKPVNLDALTTVLYATMLKIKQDIPLLNLKSQDKKVEIQEDENLDNVSLLFNLLRHIKDKDEKLELHNFYKGLSITNDAKILEVGENTIRVKTTFVQQKAVQYEGKTSIVAEALPYVVECSEVNHESFEKHILELKYLHFMKTSPIERKTIRVYPEGNYEVSLYIRGFLVRESLYIEDISIDAVRLSMESLPAGLRECEDIYLEIFLDKDQDEVEVKTKTSIFRLEETNEKFYIVFLIEKERRPKFMKYITKRQMGIIREFKGMQNE